jgi:putative membrane protein
MSSSRRLHRWSLLFLAGDSLRGLLLPLVAVFFTARQSQWDLWIAWFSLPVAVFSIWRYFTTYYELGEDELVVRTGLLFRNVRHIRYARVHNLESVQGPLHRLLRVVDLRLETAGAAEQEARLRVLSAAAADEVRRRVLEGKRRAVGAGAPVAAGAPVVTPDTVAAPAAVPAAARELVRVRLRDLVLLGLTQNRGGVVLGAGFGALLQADLFDSGFGRPTDVLQAYLSRLVDDGRLLAEPTPATVALLAAGVACVLAAIRLLSVGWTVVQLYGFTLVRDGDELRTSRGLFTRVHATIPLARVQLVTVRQPALMRLLDRVEVRVQTAGGDKHASAGREWLAPSLPTGLVDALVAEIHPEVEFSTLAWLPAAPRAAWRLRRGSLRWLAVALAVLALFPALRLPALAAVPPVVALLWYAAGRQARALGHALLPAHIAVRGGWWCRQSSLARYAKLQVVTGETSPFDRRWGMATVAADTAGGGGHRLAMPLLDAEHAGLLLAQVRARVAAAGFRW